MLSPRLTNCIDCISINVLLSQIDHKLFDLAKIEYNNVVFALNYPFSGQLMGDLLNYKRILSFKYCNEDYACEYSVEQIADRVKILINK